MVAKYYDTIGNLTNQINEWSIVEEGNYNLSPAISVVCFQLGEDFSSSDSDIFIHIFLKTPKKLSFHFHFITQLWQHRFIISLHFLVYGIGICV